MIFVRKMHDSNESGTVTNYWNIMRYKYKAGQNVLTKGNQDMPTKAKLSLVLRVHNTPIDVVVSLWILTTPGSEWTVSESLSPQRHRPPRSRATPAPHGTTCYRLKNGPQGQTRRAGSVERSRPRSPT